VTNGYFEYGTQRTLVHIATGEVWAKAVSGSCNDFEAKNRSLNPYDPASSLSNAKLLFLQRSAFLERLRGQFENRPRPSFLP
jgi:hypothetical protein